VPNFSFTDWQLCAGGRFNRKCGVKSLGSMLSRLILRTSIPCVAT